MGKSAAIPGAISSIDELAKLVSRKAEGVRFYCAPWPAGSRYIVKSFWLTKHSFLTHHHHHHLHQVRCAEGQWDTLLFGASPLRLHRCLGGHSVGYDFYTSSPIFTNYFMAYGHLQRITQMEAKHDPE